MELPQKKFMPAVLMSVGFLVLLAIVFPLAGCSLGTNFSHTSTVISPTQHIQDGPLISRDVPAFSSNSDTPASDANDATYDTTWRSQGAPAWLAYDLSSIPSAQRKSVLVAWYNESGNYDHTLINYPTYNTPENYTIDTNTAKGGSQPPATGWVTQVTVRGNHYHSRQHIISMANANWVRIDVTAIDGSAENEDASLNMDVFNASSALANDWIFFGDSITEGAMGHQTLAGTVSFPQLINEKAPGVYPAQESGGIGYLTSSNGAQYLNTWLALFPGKYVGLSYGTNDALSCSNPDTFYHNYVLMVQDVLRAGKIPVVPLIPWGRNANLQRCVPTLNTRIEALYKAFPQVLPGPNLWSFFQGHQDLISKDNIHPTEAGFGAYRQQWANTMLSEVYTKQ